ncbi:MAG: amidohydrolase [Proteobacteria bacterium]|nr:amidohydrolase [Pseudomonadota bacterium]
MIDILIKNGEIFTMSGEGAGYIEDGAVAIDGNKIAAVGPTADLEKEYQAERTVDATMKAVLPGLIDGHLHTSIALTRGVAQDGPIWAEGVDPYIDQMDLDGIKAGAQLAAVEAIRAGTTTLADYGPGVALAAPIYEEIGVRAALSGLIRELPPATNRMDTSAPLPFDYSVGERSYNQNLELVEKWHGAADGRLTAMFGPQAPNVCSKELLIRIRESAEKYDVKLHVHLAQSEAETIQIRERWGQRPHEVLEEVGYLGERLLAAHMICLDEEEVRKVARSGASMAYCPSSLVICDGIVPPADVFSREGGNVCLGTDEASSNNGTNIFSEMKLGTLFLKLKRRDPTEMPAWKILRMATIEGATALGLGKEIGSLEPGKKADLILVDLNRPSMVPVLHSPVRNIVPNLVLSARGDEVVLSIIDGRVVFENGKVLTIDEREVLAYAQKCGKEISRKAEESVRDRQTVPYQMTRQGKY